MIFQPIQIFLFIALFLPGYIFVQIKDVYLLKLEKKQFEKTVEILLMSSILWILAILISNYICSIPFVGENIDKIHTAFKENISYKTILIEYFNEIIITIFAMCLYSFLLANSWSCLRKTKRFSKFLWRFTGRDYFERVKLKFFKESIGEQIIITMEDRGKFFGLLYRAPDNDIDSQIILYDPYFINDNGEFEKMSA